jgi:segregation and condensation protein B
MGVTHVIDGVEPEVREPDGSEVSLDLASRLEALLFVADEPVDLRQLAQALQAGEDEVSVALESLDQSYGSRGLRLQRRDGSVQFVTAPQAAGDIERFLGLDLNSKLSAAALEALALIAYEQPVTRAQLEATRGVSCDGVLRTLLSRGLVAPIGRLEQAGRPILYGTTFEFLQYFGLTALTELPSVERLSKAEGDSAHES